MRRYYIGFALAIGLIFLVIILIIRALTGPSTPTTPNVTINDLASYANTDVSVRFTLDGPVTANEDHNQVIIEVNNSLATLTVTKGYNGDLVRTKNYLTGLSLYEVFLRAIKYAGFTRGDDNPALADERGHCSLGSRYIYEVVDGNGNIMKRYWRSTCGTGTFKGNYKQINTLFQRQIPDYNQLTNDVNF